MTDADGRLSELGQILVAIIGSTPILGGIGWIFKSRHDDRVAKEIAYVEEIKRLNKLIFEMHQERIRDEIVRRESVDRTMVVLNEMQMVLKAAFKVPT